MELIESEFSFEYPQLEVMELIESEFPSVSPQLEVMELIESEFPSVSPQLEVLELIRPGFSFDYQWYKSQFPSKSRQPESLAHLHRSSIPTKSFTYQELAQATDDFSDANSLGWDGCCLVYRGKLLDTHVTIKVFKFDGDDDTGFLSEILVISRINHPNIVKMVGYCVCGATRMLVLELDPNNTLDFHLCGVGTPSINWQNRMKIALGIAKGLSYLHEDRSPTVIHRNIKLSNVLLDVDFEPKIGGFNFAIQHSVSRAATCSGYMFPDYCSDNRHSDKSDVFSFGFILLELITGKKPFFYAEDQSPRLGTWILPLLKNALNKCKYTNLVDPTLADRYKKEEMGRMIHCAAACIYKLEKNRPQMKEIVQVLEGDMSVKLLWQHEKDKHYLRTLLLF